MTEYNNHFDVELSSDEQVVSYLLDIRTRILKFVSGILEATDMLQAARGEMYKLIVATRAHPTGHAESRLASIHSESIIGWTNLLTTADSKLITATQGIDELNAVIDALAGDPCSPMIRKAVHDVRAGQKHMESRLHFSRSLVVELDNLKDELIATLSRVQ